MSRNANRVQRSVSLPLECLHKAIHIHCEVAPHSLTKISAGHFHEKRFYLYLLGCGRQYDAAFGLDERKDTLVRSLMVSSMFQERPGKK
jgi:hypothetical protein